MLGSGDAVPWLELPRDTYSQREHGREPAQELGHLQPRREAYDATHLRPGDW
jgi:hypothetical protein